MVTTLQKEIGPYRTLEVLGRGGMGVVYRAKHRQTGEVVAIKSLTSLKGHPLRGIRREIEALRGLRHPGIVVIRDHGVEDASPWYAMDLLEGTPLNRVMGGSGPARNTTIADGYFPDPRDVSLVEVARTSASLKHDWTPSGDLSLKKPHKMSAGDGLDGPDRVEWTSPLAVVSTRVVLGCLAQVARALSYLHGMAIVHGDVKPANILITSDGRAVLIDFGLATTFAERVSIDEVQDAGSVLGSAAYISPERLRGDLVDGRADLYALGLMLFEALAGMHPFASESRTATIEAHLHIACPELAAHGVSVPEPLARVVAALVEKDPVRRCAHAERVAFVIDALGIETRARDAEYPESSYQLLRTGAVGRSTLIKQLTTRWKAASRGEGGVIGLVGERGVGKTRILRELGYSARRFDGAVLVGQSQADRGGPLHVFEPILRTIADEIHSWSSDLAGRALGQSAKILEPYAAFLAELPGQSLYPDVVDLAPEESRLRIGQAMLRMIAAYSGRRPLLIVVDDLQWVDPLSFEVLQYLATQSRNASWLLAIGLRAEEAPQDLMGWLAEPSIHVETIRPLKPRFIRDLTRKWLGVARAPDELERFVSEHAHGNPFVASECLRFAIERRFVHYDGVRGWRWELDRLGDLQSTQVPLRMQQVVHDRLRSLGEREREVCELVGVFGGEVDFDLLAETSDVDELRLRHAMTVLEQQALLKFFPAMAVYRFVHDTYREACLDLVESDRTELLHGKVADAMATRLDAGLPVDLGRMARHQELSGRVDRARETYFLALRDATNRRAYEAALGFLKSGLSFSDQKAFGALEARLFAAQKILSVTGRVREAERVTREVVELAELGGWDALLTAAHGALGEVLWKLGDAEEGLTHLNRALVGYESLADEAGQMRVCGNKAIALTHLFDLKGARENYHRALAFAKSTGDLAYEGIVLGNFAHLLQEAGEWDEAASYYQRSLYIAREVGDRHGEGAQQGALGYFVLQRGRHEEARERLEAAREIAEEVGDRRFEAIWLANLAILEEKEGRLEKAAASTLQSLEIARGVGARTIGAYLLVDAARIDRLQGKLETASAWLDDLEELLDDIGSRDVRGRYLCERSHLALARGEDPRMLAREVAAIIEETSAGSATELCAAFVILERAIEARALGLWLCNGTCVEDHPERSQMNAE